VRTRKLALVRPEDYSAPKQQITEAAVFTGVIRGKTENIFIGHPKAAAYTTAQQNNRFKSSIPRHCIGLNNRQANVSPKE